MAATPPMPPEILSLSADKNEQFRSKLPVWLCQQMIREAPPTTCPCGASAGEYFFFFFSVQYRPRSTTGPFFLSLIVFLFSFFPVSIIDARMAGGCRSAWQECALVVSLEMFNILLERCNAMLKEQLESSNQPATSRLLGEDLQIILPAIKVR